MLGVFMVKVTTPSEEYPVLAHYLTFNVLSLWASGCLSSVTYHFN